MKRIIIFFMIALIMFYMGKTYAGCTPNIQAGESAFLNMYFDNDDRKFKIKMPSMESCEKTKKAIEDHNIGDYRIGTIMWCDTDYE